MFFNLICVKCDNSCLRLHTCAFAIDHQRWPAVVLGATCALLYMSAILSLPLPLPLPVTTLQYCYRVSAGPQNTLSTHIVQQHMLKPVYLDETLCKLPAHHEHTHSIVEWLEDPQTCVLAFTHCICMPLNQPLACRCLQHFPKISP